MDRILKELSQWEIRPGHTYLNPAHLMSAEGGSYNIPWTTPMLSIQPMLGVTVSVPERPHSQRFFKAAMAQQPRYPGTGQSPTSGIYTGVEDSCT